MSFQSFRDRQQSTSVRAYQERRAATGVEALATAVGNLARERERRVRRAQHKQHASKTRALAEQFSVGDVVCTEDGLHGTIRAIDPTTGALKIELHRGAKRTVKYSPRAVHKT